MTDLFGLSLDTRSKLMAVFSRHARVEQVVVYGSRAIGNFRHGSDIDIVLVGSLLSTTELMKIENEIDDLLLPYKVDLSLFHQIDNGDLTNHIKNAGRLLSNGEPAFSQKNS